MRVKRLLFRPPPRPGFLFDPSLQPGQGVHLTVEANPKNPGAAGIRETAETGGFQLKGFDPGAGLPKVAGDVVGSVGGDVA